MSIWNMLTGRPARTVAGGALVVDGLIGIDTPGRKRGGLLGSLLAGLIGILFVGLGFYIQHRSQPYADGTTVTGQVASVKASTDDKGKQMYLRVVRFASGDGRQVEFAEQGSSSRRAEVGDPVKVSYRAADPSQARIIGEDSWIPLTIMGVGALVAIVGILTFIVRLVTLIAGIVLLAKR
ncbi:hypothetical protein GCM10010435_27040 [Winogradskya consettensis]|uniref:DUF3592 domain-containing protein n=1 Tax=Winogradskya consettensis TaxID=113560 RepID=A0A919S9N8_9ACTN|nr:DUF3592 domain-containing protein [Actinoplanes consettensis]GIM68223.1 hypothetical protein Aco04nite_09830 [Actinoplanes consettensis]